MDYINFWPKCNNYRSILFAKTLLKFFSLQARQNWPLFARNLVYWWLNSFKAFYGSPSFKSGQNKQFYLPRLAAQDKKYTIAKRFMV